MLYNCYITVTYTVYNYYITSSVSLLLFILLYNSNDTDDDNIYQTSVI